MLFCPDNDALIIKSKIINLCYYVEKSCDCSFFQKGVGVMAFIDDQLFTFKEMIEDSIVNGGVKGKESMIRSSQLINLIHDAVNMS